jgi:hypothetical protein
MNACLHYDVFNPINKGTLDLALTLWNTVLNEFTEEKVGHISFGAKNLYRWNKNILKLYLLKDHGNNKEEKIKEK